MTSLCESVGAWNEQMKRFLDSKAGELSTNLIFLAACSVGDNGKIKNLAESLKTVFEVIGDEESGTLEVQHLVDIFADLVLIHEDIDQILADQVMQYLLGQGFMDTDAEITSKFDGKTSMNFDSFLSAPCLQEWITSNSIVI
jgi:Ca2+-binding EF-hand superfamily protein